MNQIDTTEITLLINKIFMGYQPKPEQVYCSGCGEKTVEIDCCETIDDFCYGKPSVQRHYFRGSACCGETCLTRREWLQEKWEARGRRNGTTC